MWDPLMSEEEFNAHAMPYYKEVFGDKAMPFEKFPGILQKRTEKFTDIPEKIRFFAELPEYDKELFINKKSNVIASLYLSAYRQVRLLLYP